MGNAPDTHSLNRRAFSHACGEEEEGDGKKVLGELHGGQSLVGGGKVGECGCGKLGVW